MRFANRVRGTDTEVNNIFLLEHYQSALKQGYALN